MTTFRFHALCNEDNLNKTIDKFIGYCQLYDTVDNSATIELEVDEARLSPLALIEFDRIRSRWKDGDFIYYSIARGISFLTIQYIPNKRRTKNLIFDIQVVNHRLESR